MPALDTQRIFPINGAGGAGDHVASSPRRDVAVVSDRGRRRRRNEDAGVVVAAGEWIGLIVCDGVGSARDSDRAAHAAGDAARAALTAGQSDGHTLADQLRAAVNAAASAAQSCAGDEALPGSGDRDAIGVGAPATTLVVAVSDGFEVAAVSVGDSRVYWVPDDGAAIALTTDDSWVQAQIALGAAPDKVAHGAYAHVITRWLGAGSPPVEVRVTTRPITGPGWLVACSDGLWNYLPPAWGMSLLVAGTEPLDGLTVAERFVAWANGRGGSDNITVALGRIEPHIRTALRGAA